MPVQNSDTTMEHCVDVILEGEDYTLGKILEHIMYEQHYMGDRRLSYCGFKKFHPHNTESTLRLAFHEKTKSAETKQLISAACAEARELFAKIYRMF